MNEQQLHILLRGGEREGKKTEEEVSKHSTANMQCPLIHELYQIKTINTPTLKRQVEICRGEWIARVHTYVF